ncbi:hypothetical protein [Klebsiella variicola]|uniref:hypothetical protein n=1 Tax=Klebsiella variicola TaxID=244366 RepID=UPI00066609B0|nr:hypothetical protein [Klebsiella variicola]
MTRLTFIACAVIILLICCVLSWRAGWYTHANHIIAQAAKKKDKAEKAIQSVEQKAAAATEEGRVIYRTITRDVVKYVQSPNRTVCRFDDDAVQLRQRAIDAANAIPGFDEPSVQSK